MADTTTPAPTAPRGHGRSTRAGVTVVATLGSALSGASYWLWAAPRSCGGGLECLPAETVALAFPVVAAPLVAILVVSLARIARGPLVGLAGSAVGLLLAVAANEVYRRPGVRAWNLGYPPAPLWVYLAVGALGGLAGLVLVGRGPWPRWLRLVVLAVVAVLAWTAVAAYETPPRI